GDTRFDRVTAIKAIQKPFPLIDKFVNGRPVIVAGSTWPADENLILSLAENTGEKLKFIIAPHEVSEIRIKEIIEKFGDQAILYS
ncbi:MAG TPA: 3-deoxy-D-manno-octulosonic acid transferase, partial [Bacteroidales bacterium]|nr:3-deoxy-D-manno-octulosonic acid transferase [Bacteroidales bacterium]